MKITELIEKLQEIAKEHPNSNVLIEDDSSRLIEASDAVYFASERVVIIL